jgi:hypothetical protein
MNDSWKPWEIYPGLTQDRLLVVGDIIRVARSATADEHRPEKGETNWSLGVRNYERTCFALTSAQLQHPWLHVVTGTGGGPVHFVMSVGGHPIRFYSGEPDDIPDRYRQLSFPELVEQQRALALDDDIPVGRMLRISITTDTDFRPSTIALVEMDKQTGETINFYMIAALAATTTVTDFASPVKPVDIPPVSAEPIDAEQQDGKQKTSGDE